MNQWQVVSWIGLLAVLFVGLGATYPQMQQSQSNPRKPTPPRITPQQIAQDEAAVTAAQTSLETATEAQTSVADKHRTDFEQSKDWQTSNAQLVKAKADLNAARLQVQANLAKNSDYIAAVAARQKAASDLAQARSSGDATPDVLGPLASAVLEADANVKKMEEDAMTTDPAVVAAKSKVMAAQQPIDALNAQFEKALPQFPDWVTAHQAVQSAQKQVATAQAKLSSDQ